MARDFFLYLRPFEMKGTFFWINHNRGTLNFYAEAGFIEFEQQLANSLAPIAPPIGLGERRDAGDYVGIGRAKIPDGTDWREAVRRLASESLLNFVVPSYHKGTKWEIEFLIANGLLRKTLFLVPDRVDQGESYPEWLRLTKAAMAEFGVDPDALASRQYFELDEAMRVSVPPELKSLNTDDVRRFLIARGIMRDTRVSAWSELKSVLR